MLRYTAALPPRDDLDRVAYRAWAEFDADSPSFSIYGRRPYLRDKTDAELRQLAEARVDADGERPASPPDYAIAVKVLPLSPEPEAGA